MGAWLALVIVGDRWVPAEAAAVRMVLQLHTDPPAIMHRQIPMDRLVRIPHLHRTVQPDHMRHMVRTDRQDRWSQAARTVRPALWAHWARLAIAMLDTLHRMVRWDQLVHTDPVHTDPVRTDPVRTDLRPIARRVLLDPSGHQVPAAE